MGQHPLDPTFEARNRLPHASLLGVLHEKSMALDGETGQVVRFVTAACTMSGRRVLDVGCGYGRCLERLHAAGFDVTGVDINPDIVSANRQRGLHCLGVDEFRATRDEYDVILMSHFIEHFAPESLLAVMDGYLDRLKKGGRLVIATPLMSDYFYDDFDHIKPYQPAGIRLVFEDKGSQVQYRARNRLAMRDLWFRRAPWKISHARGRYFPGLQSRLLIVLDLLAAAVFLLSFRRIGRVDGWVGVYEKTSA
jgi:SAM-dependent methyltransferase